jgi:hypothetical protein
MFSSTHCLVFRRSDSRCAQPVLGQGRSGMLVGAVCQAMRRGAGRAAPIQVPNANAPGATVENKTG